MQHENSSTELQPVLEGCFEACRRMETVLDQLDASQYSSQPPAGGGSIGEHMRHCLDHFICLLRGLDSGVVAYDSRDRDPLLETDPVHARHTLDLIRRNLAAAAFAFTTTFAATNSSAATSSLSASSSSSSSPSAVSLKISQTPAPGHDPIEIPTSLARELAFLSSHSVHHLALMAEVARRQEIPFPENMTLAFSTAAYRDSKSPQS